MVAAEAIERQMAASAQASANLIAELASESEAFTRGVLDNLFSFAWVLTPDGTLIEANRAPLEAADLVPAEVVGRKLWDTWWWSHDPDVQAELRQAVARAAGGETIRYDASIRVAGDRQVWIDFQLAPLRNDAGEITHLVPSGLDLTPR
jgi:PAS domain S-box-containing protein